MGNEKKIKDEMMYINASRKNECMTLSNVLGNYISKLEELKKKADAGTTADPDDDVAIKLYATNDFRDVLHQVFAVTERIQEQNYLLSLLRNVKEPAKNVVKGDYVLTPCKNAFNERTSWWISKRGYTASYYCFTADTEEDINIMLACFDDYCDMYEVKNGGKV